MRSFCARSARAWTLPMVCTLAILLPLSLTGCSKGSGKKLTAVSGRITYEGEPLSDAIVAFMNEADANASPGTAITDSDGEYSLKLSADEVGVPAGKYKVGITAWDVQPTMSADGKPEPGVSAIPKTYFDPNTSNLTATVEDKASQTIDFDLKKQ